MADRTIFRLRDIAEAIDQIEFLLRGKTFDDVRADRNVRAAFERFLEIISEASRHIPKDLRDQAPEIPWVRVSDIGNHLRHAYNRVDAEILWDLHQNGDLSTLHRVITAFIDRLAKGE